MQLLNEHTISHELYLYETHREKLVGNAFYLSLLTDLKKATFFNKGTLHAIDSTIEKKCLEEPRSYYIPEGADCLPALWGAMTLGSDIIANLQEKIFDHIFVDAGTGFSAIGLLLSLASLSKLSSIHIVSMAIDEATFIQKLKYYLEAFGGFSLEELPSYFFYYPSKLKSFGSTSKNLFTFIESFAKEEGVLLDPIYSAKLLLEAEAIMDRKSLKGSILLVHSGGALSLSGFCK